MVCLLSFAPDRSIAGWIIATDLADLRRQVQGRANFDASLNDVAQAISVMEGGEYHATQGRHELLAGRFTLLFG